MKINKIIAFALACTLAAGSFEMLLAAQGEGNTVYARAERSAAPKAEAEKIRTEVLKRAEIPDGYTNFSCEAAEEDGNTFYELCWTRKRHGEIHAAYYNGLIYGYTADHDDHSSKPSFGKLSEAEQEKIAYEHICRLNPDMRGKFELGRKTDLYDLDSRVEYNIFRVEQGLGVDNSGYISIDKNSGELLKFYLDSWYMNADFPNTKNMLTKEEAFAIFTEKADITGEYKMYYNHVYDSESYTHYYVDPYVLPVYKIEITGSSRIDGITGERSGYYSDFRDTELGSLYSWGKYGGSSVETCGGSWAGWSEVLCEAAEFNEKDNKSENFITAEKAEEILKADGVIIFNDKLTLTEDKINYYSVDNKEVRALRYVKFEYDPKDKPRDKITLWAELDALSGEIVSFGKKYYYNEKSKEPLEEKAAAAAAKKAAAHFMGSRAAEYRFEKLDGSENAAEKTAVLVRYVNGLPAGFDKAYVKVDSRGEIMGFEYTCSNAKFPMGRVMTKEEALDNLFEQAPPLASFDGFTDKELKAHIYLTYYMGREFYMDAITGERYDEDGKPYYKKPEKPKFYTDVSGHEYEKEIRELFRYGVRLGDDEWLRPDDPITLEEFAKLCRKAQTGYISSSEVYDVITETDPETGKTSYHSDPAVYEPLTYSGLARLFVRHYEDEYHSPSLNANYKQPYKNVTKDNPDYAYIAIAKKQGYISKGDEFDYSKTLTRGECMKILYDYIASDGEKKELYEIFKI